MCSDAGAERAAQADLGAALEHRDDHHVGDPDAADQQRHRAEAEEHRGERALRVRARLQRVGGTADLRLFGVLRVGGRGQQRGGFAHPFGVGAHVQRARVRVVPNRRAATG